MKRFFGVLALVFGLAGTASAQSALRINTSVGTFAPMLPLVSVADGLSPDVELQSAPAATLELGFAARSWATVYGGVTYAQPRLALSAAQSTDPQDGATARGTLLIPTAGVLLSRPRAPGALHPTLRLGVGVKSYGFDVVGHDDRITALTGDFGLGLAAGDGPFSVMAEARWLPSRFDASELVDRASGSTDQDQNDWLFQLGFRFRP